ncbi:MAG TPA: sulfocyanin-like copper-binding protein, partial [Gemmatimonadales bacterium]|nr:sulfocyanin-like copper-binding protein [Gemmatimonadales bacterium]
RTGLLYVVASHATFTLTRADALARKGEVFIGGAQKLHGDDPLYGTISAIRPSSGKIAWQQRTPLLMSGALATAGDLVFVGDIEGWFRAYDARTGTVLWEFFCGAGVNAPSISYEIDGEQFIAVVAAGSRYSDLQGSALLVFGLGTGSAAPVQPPVTPDRTPSTPGAVAQENTTAEWPPADATRAGAHLVYRAAEKTAYLEIDADLPMGFDGATNGGRTFTVPLGWNVEVRFRNRDAVPHSARVVASTETFSLSLAPSAFAAAETIRPETGIRSGGTDVFRFRAERAGAFLIACAVPGHAGAGMFVRLNIQADASVPTVQ